MLTRQDYQLVFIDTPGIHEAKKALNRYMVEVAREAVFDTDVVALLIDVSNAAENLPGKCEVLDGLLETLKSLTRPVVLVLNKIDLIEKHTLLPMIEQWSEALEFSEIVPLCARGRRWRRGL